MRTICKRLTVANDGFCNFKLSARDRVELKINKYINKMKEKGWKFESVCGGNAFCRYEMYVTLSKSLG